MQVIDDVTLSDNVVKFYFSDSSKVKLQQHHDKSGAPFTGECTPQQAQAVQQWTGCKVN